MHMKIPLNRIGALVGQNGRIKRAIEKRFDVKVDVNSKAGDVDVTRATIKSDPSALFRVRDIVLAIGRGFSSENAFRLFNEEISFGILEQIFKELKGESSEKMVKLEKLLKNTLKQISLFMDIRSQLLVNLNPLRSLKLRLNF